MSSAAVAQTVREMNDKAEPYAVLSDGATCSEGRLKAYPLDEFLGLPVSEREMLLYPIIPRKGLVMLSAWRGIGKTHFALGIAYAISSGASFLKWKAEKPARVLLIDGEMPAGALQERLARIVSDGESAPQADHLKILAADCQEFGIPDLSSTEGQQAVEEYVGDADLIILDNLSTLCRSGKENESESWLPVQEWLLSLRRRGKTVLIIHHNGKNGLQRGTSRREDVLDTVISLTRPSDYKAEQGARVEVHYEKARGLFGEDVLPFEALLKTEGDKSWWEIKELENSDMKLVIELTRNSRLGQREIAKRTGISRSKVNRLVAKAKETGDL